MIFEIIMIVAHIIIICIITTATKIIDVNCLLIHAHHEKIQELEEKIKDISSKLYK